MIAVSDGVVRSVRLLPPSNTIQVGDPLRVGNERMLSITVDCESGSRRFGCS